METRRQVLQTATAALAIPAQRLLGTPASSSLSATIPQCPPLPPGELGRWMDTQHRYNLIDFLNSLEAARAMWRKCPQFVQAPTLDWVPPEMMKAFQEEYANFGYEDGQLSECFPGDKLLEPDYPAALRNQGKAMVEYSEKKRKDAAA